MRNQRGWTQEETAAKMLVSTSTIANVESGYRPPTPAQALKADEVFGTPGTFQRHEQRMRGIPFSAGFRPFQPYEEEARVLRMFEHTLIPGLFQTEGYARVLAEAYLEASEQDVKDRVNARMARQVMLTREDPPPPRVWAVIDEQVLYREVGGPAVMATQMEHLAELARMPRVTIQVIPASCPHPGLLGAFVVAETDQPPAIDTAMEGTNRHVTTWRKSSYSGGNGGNCVEVGGAGPAVMVRDTQDRAGAVLAFGPDAWRRFAATIKDTHKA